MGRYEKQSPLTKGNKHRHHRHHHLHLCVTDGKMGAWELRRQGMRSRIKFLEGSSVQTFRCRCSRWVVFSKPFPWRCRSPDHWPLCRFRSCGATSTLVFLHISVVLLRYCKHSLWIFRSVLHAGLVLLCEEKGSPPVARVLPWKSCEGQNEC